MDRIFSSEQAEGYDKRILKLIPDYAALLTTVGAAVRNELASGRVLIFGAGTGAEIPHLSGFDLTAYEPSEPMRALGQSKFPDVHWAEPIGTYDAVVSCLVAHFQSDFGSESVHRYAPFAVVAAMVRPESDQEAEQWMNHLQSKMAGPENPAERRLRAEGVYGDLSRNVELRSAAWYEDRLRNPRGIFARPMIRAWVSQ